MKTFFVSIFTFTALLFIPYWLFHDTVDIAIKNAFDNKNFCAFAIVLSICIFFSLALFVHFGKIPLIKKNPREFLAEMEPHFFGAMVFGSVLLLYVLILFITLYFVFSFIGKIDTTAKDDEFLTLLEVILAFISIMSIGLYKFIEVTLIRKIKGNIEQRTKRERELSHIDRTFNLVVLHFSIYENIYKGRGRSEKALNQLKTLGLVTALCEQRIGEVKDGGTYRFWNSSYSSKNNYAFFLQQKWEYIRSDNTEVSRDDEEFRNLLKADPSLMKEYSADKRRAFQIIDILNKQETRDRIKGSVRDHFFSEFFDTEERGRATFSI